MVLTLVVCYFAAGNSGFAGVSSNFGQPYVFASLPIVSASVSMFSWVSISCMPNG